jgi:hypothetical protein
MHVAHATFGRLHPWPLGVRAVSLLVTVFVRTWIPHVAFGLRASMASPSVSLGFSAPPCCPSDDWEEKPVSGGGTILTMEGNMEDPTNWP